MSYPDGVLYFNSKELTETSAGNIIDDLMILFEIKEMPKIQLDEQSRSNQEKWLKCHRLVNVKKMNLFCFTCLQF